MNRFSANLCQHPLRYGVVPGILFLILMRSVSLFVQWAISPAEYTWVTTYSKAYILGSFVLPSLLMGAVLGGLSATLAAAWLKRDLGGLRHTTQTCIWIMLLLFVWQVWRFGFMLRGYWWAFGSGGAGLSRLGSIPWQAKLAVLSLMINTPLLWALTLVGIGTILSRRLLSEAKRARQFEPLPFDSTTL